MQTLKSKYQTQKLLEQRAYRVDRLIRENFDKATANKALGLIKQLNGIKWPAELHSFQGATKTAVAELKNVLAGGDRKKGLFDKIIGLFKSQKDNPFMDVVAYTSALHSFFTVMSKLVEALDTSGGQATTVGDVVSNGDTDFDESTFKKIVQKGLKPEGVMANIQTNWFQKYMQGNSDKVAEEIGNMDIGQLKDFSNDLIQRLSGTKDIASQVAAVDQAIAQNKDEPFNKEDQPTVHQEPSEPTKATTPTKPDTVKSGHQNVNAPKANSTLNTPLSDEDIIDVGKKVAVQLQDLGVKNVHDVLKALNTAGALKKIS